MPEGSAVLTSGRPQNVVEEDWSAHGWDWIRRFGSVHTEQVITGGGGARSSVATISTIRINGGQEKGRVEKALVVSNRIDLKSGI